MLRKAFGMVVISGCLLAWAGCAQNTGGGPGIDGGHGQDLAPACNGMVCIPGCACMTGLKCDPSSKTCVQCLTNGDCAAGSVCDPTAHTCGAGCAANQPCAPDGGKCDLDGGVCVQCLGDNDCLDPANGHCNPATHKCAPCVPSNDTCGYGTYCGTTMNGNLDCIPGCKNDTDCLPARPAPMPDLKMSPLDMTAPPSDMTAPPSDGAVCMMNDAGACVIPDGGAPTDLSSPTDLSRPGDLASPRDLLTPPDLAPVDNAPRCDTKVHTCVRCLIDNDCPPGRVCKAEQCVPGCTDLHACNGALACCMDQCTDTTSDSQNCGNCGNICQGGWNCCGSACSNPVNDVNNCGSCGNACKAQNGTPTCTARACAIAKCNPGWADCNGVVMDGCETHTDVNPNSCGSCGNTCYFPHASSKCLGGVCAVDTCASGFGNCDMDPNDANGCETNTNTDPMNCGGCAMTCSTNNISPACSLGMCSGTCVTGFADCNGDKRTDGCEANLGTDPMNCGSCGTNCAKQCALNVAATTCTSGTCGITACQPGFYDLDGQCANGCECQAMPPSGGTCAMPAASPSLVLGQSLIINGNIPVQGGEAWYRITFTGNTDPSYHPHIQITDPNNAFQFDIITDCGNPTSGMPCGTETGSSLSRTDWDVKYTMGDPNSFAPPDMAGEPDAMAPPDGGSAMGVPNFKPIPPVGNNGVVYVRVFRATGSPTCTNYALTISN